MISQVCSDLLCGIEDGLVDLQEVGMSIDSFHSHSFVLLDDLKIIDSLIFGPL
jgi:hypothetical protein